MSIAEIPLDKIDESTLQSLVRNEVDERLRLDYKLKLAHGTNDEKKELLRDVASFANTAGGDILFGIRDEQGKPVEIVGVSIDNPDAFKLQVESLVRDNLEPKLSGHAVRTVPLQRGKYVVVLRIPRSYAGPHAVGFRKSPQFWARRSNGKYPLEINELRSAFLLSETAAEKIREFRTDRVSKLLAGEGPVIPKPGPKLIVHLIPIDAFQLGRRVDLRSIEKAPSNLGPVIWGCTSTGVNLPHTYRFNLDGLLAAYQVPEGKAKGIASCQWFWNGIVESYDPVEPFEGDGDKELAYAYIENELPASARRLLDVQQKVGIRAPIVVLLTLCDVQGFIMKVPRTPSFHRPHHPIDRDHLFVPEVMIESFDCDTRDVLRPIIDGVWNAAGYAESPVKHTERL